MGSRIAGRGAFRPHRPKCRLIILMRDRALSSFGRPILFIYRDAADAIRAFSRIMLLLSGTGWLPASWLAGWRFPRSPFISYRDISYTPPKYFRHAFLPQKISDAFSRDQCRPSYIYMPPIYYNYIEMTDAAQHAGHDAILIIYAYFHFYFAHFK